MSVAVVSPEAQARLLMEKQTLCYTQPIHEQDTSDVESTGCVTVWDGVLCWPTTANGTTVSLPCPDYVERSNIAEYATKTCNNDGTWWMHPGLNNSWTNLTLCFPEKPEKSHSYKEIIAAHMGGLRLMYNIGYGISLLSLILAVLIMLYFKRLHCQRNVIHVNMFVSFILRAIISFVKENALVDGVGFSSDVNLTDDGTILFLDTGSHWQCKAFFSLFNYILGANYMWIFVEGIYLHMLITVAMFCEKSGVKRLVLFGWGAPILFVIPWMIIRATLEDVLCWNTHPTHGYFWIIRGPIVAAMAINFIIFLNIIRVLFTKLNAFKTPDVKRYRYRKLAKSTLVLIPLFGVHYIVFLWLPDEVDETTELVKLYYEMFFNSFQGFFVSLLFCFLNGEVQSEFRKKWKIYILKRDGSKFGRRTTRDTMTSFVSRTRGSSASSKDLENGKSFKCNGKLQNTSLSSDNSDCNPDILESRDTESQPMVELVLQPANRKDEFQPIINNNIHHTFIEDSLV